MKEQKSAVFDSDSKDFFDEVINDQQDLDVMLLDLPNIEEEHNVDDHYDELEIKKEIQTMKQKDLKNLLKNEMKIIHPSDDEEGS